MARSDARAGALDKPIEIQRAVKAQDTAGEVIITWQRLANEWASVESVDQSENYSADRVLSFKLKWFTIRWVSWLGSENRIVYDGDNYDILSIAEMENVGRNRFLRILAEVKV